MEEGQAREIALYHAITWFQKGDKEWTPAEIVDAAGVFYDFLRGPTVDKTVDKKEDDDSPHS